MSLLGYKINGVPIKDYGLRAGWIGGNPQSYALSGIWSLPKRLGTTFYNWAGVIEPYVDADDIEFETRSFDFNVVALACSLAELQLVMERFCAAVGDSMVLSHPLLGSYEVLVQQFTVKHYENGWGAVTLKLRELTPITLSSMVKLPVVAATNDMGIDGYSWEELGLVAVSIDGLYGLTQFTPLPITQKNHAIGSRAMRALTLRGKVMGASYDDFNAKVKLLQAVLGGAGLRAIKYMDGTVRTAFCAEGFTVNNVVGGVGKHWGDFNCKMIEVDGNI